MNLIEIVNQVRLIRPGYLVMSLFLSVLLTLINSNWRILVAQPFVWLIWSFTFSLCQPPWVIDLVILQPLTPIIATQHIIHLASIFATLLTNITRNDKAWSFFLQSWFLLDPEVYG